jgi:medium-chain acyl-[acyl-carrier-protein] hydrolase
MRLVLPGVRTDFALSERYVYRAEPPLDLPIHLLLGDHDPYVEAERAAGWSWESTQPLRRHRYPGDHFFLNVHQRSIAALLADTAAQALADPVTGRGWSATESKPTS